MRIAVAGSGRLGWSLLSALLESDHEIVAVLQDGRRTRGFQRHVAKMQASVLGSRTTVIGLAAQHRIPVIWLDRLSEEALAPLRAQRPDIILVGGFGIIFKRIILELPRIGCVNCHSSLLPKHRGPNPFAAVVLQGDTESGVTFHIMDDGIDTGDILAQYPYPVAATNTPLDIYNDACRIAGEHVAAVVEGVERDGFRGTPQDHQAASYDKQITREAAKIDWSLPAIQIERMVRAFKTSCLARCQYGGREIILSMVKVVHAACPNAEPGRVLAAGRWVRVAAGDGAVDIVLAYKLRPVPWIWPSRWSRPRVGDRLE